MKARFNSARILVVACAFLTGPLLAADSQAPSTRPVPATAHTLPQPEFAGERNSGLLQNSGFEVSDHDNQPERYVSPWLSEVLKLSDAGVDDAILLAFVDKAGTFNLTAPDIIRLSELGVRSEVLTLMLQHDAELAAGLRPEPAPPSRSGMPRLLVRKAPPGATRPTPAPRPAATDHESIVNPSPAPDYSELIALLAGPRPAAVRPNKQAPVREPVPVPLTSTIIVHRSAGRMPNTLFLEMFPE